MKLLTSRYVLIPILCLLAVACAGTRSAYQAAQDSGDPEVYAYVIAQHYSALVKEAADRKESGSLTGVALQKVQQADEKARPIIIGDESASPPKAGIEQLAKAYTATKSAADQAALQKALNDAVLALNDFINTLKGTRS